MLLFRTAVVVALLSSAEPIWACSAVGPLPSARDLVERATAIVRVRAVGLSVLPGERSVLAPAVGQVNFEVLEVLKGVLPETSLQFNGALSDNDDLNDKPVPYRFVRPGGRQGNCYAMQYRVGAEYLLLLRPATEPGASAPGPLTPYWAPLSPANEQLAGGAADPWVVWVRARPRRKPGA